MTIADNFGEFADFLGHGNTFGGPGERPPMPPAVERGFKLEKSKEDSRRELGLWFRGFALRVHQERGT